MTNRSGSPKRSGLMQRISQDELLGLLRLPRLKTSCRPGRRLKRRSRDGYRAPPDLRRKRRLEVRQIFVAAASLPGRGSRVQPHAAR
jgi:hypothetical protein